MTVLTWRYPKLTRGPLVTVFKMITNILRILIIPKLRLVMVRIVIPGIHKLISVWFF